MSESPLDWPAYIGLMAQLLEVPLDAPRREELALQLARIAAIAGPLMAFELPMRQEGAGVYRL
ncbi:oxalurate catabolism protein HpxX [uncultured Pluralibacter sp.]|uniref:oxalurate catabolism protein HpxX n=1 Tax=uncultured Pluralibacter sp. TaxID=1490864 RepID=UPI00262779D1|nr:oxalurate catabolism protein HpxX [uncultured Pluralibacter sp.]